jgi:hypothetical protein
MINHIRKAAVEIFVAILKSSAKFGGTFKLMMLAQIGRRVKPLLLVGRADSMFESGRCIAVLQPSQGLIDDLTIERFFYDNDLKEIVAGKCEAALNLRISRYEKYKRGGVKTTAEYRAVAVKSAKHSAR